MDLDALTPGWPDPGAGSQFFRSTDPSGANVIEGVLFLFFETGSQGGYWAFQNKGFIRQNETRFVCRKCHLYWDKETEPLVPVGGARFYRGSIPY
jgi:hypothetical protein